VPFYSTLSTVFFRRCYVSWPRKVCSGEGAICFNQRGMFHGYHDARRSLLGPCNNNGKTHASFSYKSQRMYCTEGGGEKRNERGEEEKTGGGHKGKERTKGEGENRGWEIFWKERKKQRDGEIKLQRKKEGKRRTTVGLPLHLYHNVAIKKGVSINRKKENRGSRVCTERRRATVAPHNTFTGQQPPSHRLKATSSSTPTRDQKEKNQTEADEEGKKKTEAGVSARGRRRKAAANTTRHRHNHREPSSASSPPPPASLWASAGQPSSPSPFPPPPPSSSSLHRLHCSAWTVESAPLFTGPDKSGPAQNEWSGPAH